MWTECERFPVRASNGEIFHVIAGEHIAEMGFGSTTVRITGFFLAEDGTVLRQLGANNYEVQRTGEVYIRVSAYSLELAAA